MITYIEYLGIPGTIATAIVAVFFVMQIIGLILDIKGKAVPMIMNIFGYFKKRKATQQETAKTLEKVKVLLNEVNGHYSADNITKRDDWMKQVDNRVAACDTAISAIEGKIDSMITALNDNTSITEEMFVQTSRDRIIDFATRVCHGGCMVSREEYNRIFKIYQDYEEFIKRRGLSNGEVDINFHMITQSYEQHVADHSFAEDQNKE